MSEIVGGGPSAVTPAPVDALTQLARLPERGIDWTVVSDRVIADVAAARRAAVLVLFGPVSGNLRGAGPFPSGAAPSAFGDSPLLSPTDLDLLLLRRSSDLRHHPGQIGFPGGAIDPGDASPTAAALREAVEETGIDTAGLQVFGELPQLPLPVSNFMVTPVPAWWHHPSLAFPVDTAETTEVFRVPVGELLDASNRVNVRRFGGQRFQPIPGFRVGGRLVWGFTAIVLDRMFSALGWEQPWDHDRFAEPEN